MGHRPARLTACGVLPALPQLASYGCDGSARLHTAELGFVVERGQHGREELAQTAFHMVE